MTILDDRVTVWRLAVLTEDRDITERRALRDEAQRLEREWNKLTVGNIERRLATLGPLDLCGPNGITPTKQHAEWRDRFERDWNAYLAGGPRALAPQP